MIGLVLARVVLSVSGNAVQKRLVLNGAEVRMTWIVTYFLMLWPALLLAIARPVVLEPNFWWNILLGGLLDAFGNLAMMAALRATDLSVFGPLNAFRPVLALLFGWVFLRESPTTLGTLGLAITVGGATLLLNEGKGPRSHLERRLLWQVLGLRITGLVLSTFGAVFLKRAAMTASTDWALAGWILCGLICLWCTALWRRERNNRSLLAGFQCHRAWLLLHAAFFLVMQWLTIRIFQETLLAYSFVFFQLGMILQVVYGRVLFQESEFRRRLVACVVMGLGSALIFLKG